MRIGLITVSTVVHGTYSPPGYKVRDDREVVSELNSQLEGIPRERIITINQSDSRIYVYYEDAE